MIASDFSADDEEVLFGDLGDQGWELTSVYSSKVYFKRIKSKEVTKSVEEIQAEIKEKKVRRKDRKYKEIKKNTR